MVKDYDNQESEISKSQLKREMEEFRNQAKWLADFPNKELHNLNDDKLVDAIREAKRIHKGSAKKRQIQYIARLIKEGDTEAIKQFIDSSDSSSKTQIARFHQLEVWRDSLLENTSATITDIIEHYPDVDRQALRQLVKQATKERDEGTNNLVYYRKLFQFLKSIDGSVLP